MTWVELQSYEGKVRVRFSSDPTNGVLETYVVLADAFDHARSALEEVARADYGDAIEFTIESLEKGRTVHVDR